MYLPLLSGDLKISHRAQLCFKVGIKARTPWLQEEYAKIVLLNFRSADFKGVNTLNKAITLGLDINSDFPLLAGAISSWDSQTTYLLLAAGADPNKPFICTPKAYSGTTPIHVAAGNVKPDLLIALHEQGANLFSTREVPYNVLEHLLGAAYEEFNTKPLIDFIRCFDYLDQHDPQGLLWQKSGDATPMEKLLLRLGRAWIKDEELWSFILDRYPDQVAAAIPKALESVETQGKPREIYMTLAANKSKKLTQLPQIAMQADLELS